MIDTLPSLRNPAHLTRFTFDEEILSTSVTGHSDRHGKSWVCYIDILNSLSRIENDVVEQKIRLLRTGV